ncbi:alpha beta-hydrolase [Fusarium denticulatum]|uniref:Alpha beta-hydrolase n=1 Tax=Fusarium denticulatum TaxID=48507 RepID=A0A8H5U8C7_9HYPO|nr:alpha beta-hydrolase [Fusarium denticulatum]
MKALLCLLSVLSTIGSCGPTHRCQDVTFSVSGTAENFNITGIPLNNPSSLAEILLTVKPPGITISGSQTLAGRFCEPTVDILKNKGKLQVLFSSITGNRENWSAQGGPTFGFMPYKSELYSWVDYANAQGYPTLALDRLGSGKSSHPDPVLVVQAPYENALYHDLAQQIRSGSTGSLPHKFDFLVWVGNSYGSQLGAAAAGRYPKDFDEYVLTGFSKSVLPSLPGISLQKPVPAAVAIPDRYGHLSPGYVTSSNEPARTGSFFGSKAQADWDSINSQLFYERRDVVSLGQFFSVYGLPFLGNGFTGRVLVLTGEQDQAFCGPGSSTIGPAYCGPLLRQTGSLFPDAEYNWKSVDRTGHAIQFFMSASKVRDIAHRFLAGENFHGGPPA